MTEKFRELTGHKLLEKFRACLKSERIKILLAVRKRSQGTYPMVSEMTLRGVLERYTFPMTDSQWQEFVVLFRSGSPDIDFAHFMECFTPLHPPLPKSAAREALLRAFYRGCAAKSPRLLRAFKAMDPGDGTVGESFFRHVLSSQLGFLSGEFFQLLVPEVPYDKSGRVRYREFLVNIEKRNLQKIVCRGPEGDHSFYDKK